MFTDTKTKHSNNSFKRIVRNCVYKIGIKIEEHILVTHNELAALRNCSRVISADPNRFVYVVAPAEKKQTNFIIRTLMHLGVSCGQISFIPSKPRSDRGEEILLYVANR